MTIQSGKNRKNLMAEIEYKKVTSEFYMECCQKTDELLVKIVKFVDKSISTLNYSDVIAYFEANYDILFTFFDHDFRKKKIRFNDLVSKSEIIYQDETIIKNISGVTIPKEGRILILLNQRETNCKRIIFTLLHELVHLYYHLHDEKHKSAFASMVENQFATEKIYIPEAVPLEDEANVIASILFCPRERLESLLIHGCTFKDIMKKTGMSQPALHNRMLNYFEHILDFGEESLGKLLDYKNSNEALSHEVQAIIYRHSKHKKEKPRRFISSDGEIFNQTSYTKFLESISFEDLLDEYRFVVLEEYKELELLVRIEMLRKRKYGEPT